MVENPTLVHSKTAAVPATPQRPPTRNQKKFPRAIRFAIVLGVPAMLWAAIYFIGAALL